jgi:cell division protein FtsB
MGADNQAEKVIDRIERMERMQAEIERLKAENEQLKAQLRQPCDDAEFGMKP